VQAAIDKRDPRANPRSNVFLTAILSADATCISVKIRNLSVHGALLEGAALPGQGERAFLRRGSLQVPSVVAWRNQSHCGICFESPIEVAQWVKRVGSPEQQKIDAAIAEIRGGSPSRHAALHAGRNERDLLTSASVELQEICERLASLPDMSVALAEELVKLDALVHSLKAGH
jgi:hypothetical protein